MGKLFGTDGVRGVVGRELTPELALRLGRAIGAYFGSGARVLVGRDVRSGGDMLASAVISGMLAEGVRVYYAGLAPTPAIQYNVKYLGFDGGVIVTASHNPPEYNGIKVVASDGVEISRKDEEIIEEYYFEGKASTLPWRSLSEDASLRTDIIENYVNAITNNVDRDLIAKKGFKVVVDCANSVGALATPLVLRRLGVKVISVNCHLDPTFPGREPEPTPSTLALTARIVREAGADLGLGHDGDADRAILITETGEVLWGDRSGCLLTEFAARVWRELPKRAYTGVSSSIVVEDYLRPRGIEVVWTPVGSVVISRMIIEAGGAVSGFEENGGYMHIPHQIVRDGAMKAALTLYMMAHDNVKLGELAGKLPRYYTIKTKIPATRDEALCAVRAVKKHYSEYRLVTIDGVKVMGDGWWVLVRPSGTEPVVRIMLEAKSKEEAERLLGDVKSVIKSECGLGG
ncbi:MAG: phosphoglucosamine mutase [Desulfurococcales archaeon]|nr:phosphoglucosamine mutase [Desulfurococcales archaeon]